MPEYKGLVNQFVFTLTPSLLVLSPKKHFWETFIIKELHFIYTNYQWHAFSK